MGDEATSIPKGNIWKTVAVWCVAAVRIAACNNSNVLYDRFCAQWYMTSLSIVGYKIRITDAGDQQVAARHSSRDAEDCE